ncbi:MAG: Ldh family oxidoreductase [Burkholderiales bacterium]
MNHPRFAPDALEGYARGIASAMGAPAEVAGEVARHLVRSNLAGQDSHGVLRLPQYAGQADRGELVATGVPRILAETPATVLIDAQRGFGHYAAHTAVELVAGKARATGIGAAAIRHSTHIGRMGEYTERCEALGLVLIATVGMAGPGVGGVVPFGGRERFFGANVWSIGVPGGSTPMVFDASMSSIAVGKVYVAKAAGRELPPGCVVDREGAPATHPDAFLEGGAALPMGGDVAGHKGFGLGLAAALLGGLAMIGDTSPTLAGAPAAAGSTATGRMAGAFLIAIDPEAFGGVLAYRALVDECLHALRAVQPAPGVEAVTVPGERSRATRLERMTSGIPLAPATCDELAKLGQRFGVAMASSLGS